MFARYIRAALIGTLFTVFLGGAAVITRLLPWLVSPAVPRAVSWIFAKSLATATFEVALVIGCLVGFALCGSAEVASGEARVRELFGVSPVKTAVRIAARTTPLAALLFLSSFLAGRDASEPGTIVNHLIGEARASCAASAEPTMVEVPFANASWLCRPGDAPLFFMNVRGLPIAAREASVGSSLTNATLVEVQSLVGPATVTASRVVVRGLRSWTLPSPLSPAARALGVTLGTFFASFVALTLLFRQRSGSRGMALLVSLGAASSLFFTLRSLDRFGEASALVTPVGVVLLCVVPAATVALLIASVRALSRRLLSLPRAATVL